MRRLLTLFTLLLGCLLGSQAQEAEYQAEVGGGLGGSFYLGDVNSTPFKGTSLAGTLLFRRLLNPRMALKGNLALARLRGNSTGVFIPADATSQTASGGQRAHVAFKRNVVDLGGQFEFNFWGYGSGPAYLGYSRLTPYVTAGLGITLAMGGGGDLRGGLNFPVGAGVKYKLSERLNVGAEWTFRFTTLDALDVNQGQATLAHPYGIRSVGLKNKDAYSFFTLSLTYDIMAKCRDCHNND